ncbi:hypothetical protein MPER_13276 [Moniliophthora perniciosa FA553]|nr:hypothetical protein MPER_13276 [Moniliophthora perniciosa FA553]
MKPHFARTLPPDLVDIIIGFAQADSISNPNDVAEMQNDRDDTNDQVEKRKGKEREKRAVPLLLTLGLVCKTWLALSRRHFFLDRDAFFNGRDKQKQVLLFLAILSGQKRLPNLPHILSFITRPVVTIYEGWPSERSYIAELLVVLLEKMSARKTHFRPQHLTLVLQTTLHPHVIRALSMTFSTINTLLVTTDTGHSHNSTDVIQLITSFPDLQAAEIDYRQMNGGGLLGISGYCLQDSLNFISFDLGGIRDSETLSLLTEWLESNPTAHSIRSLDFLSVSIRHKDFIQSFLAICPNLENLWIGADTHRLSANPKQVIDKYMFDLTSLTRLRFFGLEMVPIKDGSIILNTFARTVQTIKSPGTSVVLRFSLRDYIRVPHGWWSPVDQAMSELPQDVTFRIRALRPYFRKEVTEEFKIRNQEGIIRKVGALFPRTEEQSRLVVCPEFWDDTEFRMDFYDCDFVRAY